MNKEENGNRPRGDDAAPPPADPRTQDPPLPTDTVLLDQEEDDPSRTSPGEEDSAQATHSPDMLDFELVLNNGTTRRIKKGRMNKITLTGPQPKAPQTRIRNILPPPTELYHGNQTSVYQEEKGLAITYAKIKYTQNFSKMKNKAVAPPTGFLYANWSLEKGRPEVNDLSASSYDRWEQ